MELECEHVFLGVFMLSKCSKCGGTSSEHVGQVAITCKEHLLRHPINIETCLQKIFFHRLIAGRCSE